MLNDFVKKWIPLITLLILMQSLNLLAEDSATKASGKKQDELKSWLLGSRPSQLNRFWKKAQNEEGNEQYLRKGLHTGNLVETSYLNRGQLSDGYHGSNFQMSWPRGSGISYGYLFDFCVAGEVLSTTGDTIHIVSDCFKRSGVEQAPDGSHWYFWEPLPGYFNDRHPNSTEFFIGGISEDVGIDGYPNTHDEGEGNGELDTGEDINSNGVLDRALLNVLEYPAMSHAAETWPEYWPPQSYPGDDRTPGEHRPGVRAGRWNGEFGAYVRADQESYYVMDDRENDEFPYHPFSDSLSNRPWPNGRQGLGITCEVRNYQWNHPLAEDIIVSRYNIINYGKDIEKTIVGMYSDVDVGGSSGGDDANYDKIDDITYVWDKSGLAQNGLPTGYFGFAFLESPGLDHNNIDDDEDGLVDENQANNIDEDGDWKPWQDVNGNGIYDSEDKNYNGELDPGEDLNENGELDYEPINNDVGSDGLGPEDDVYPGPDTDGTEANGKPDQGEPNFGKTDNDEIDQIGLTSWYLKDVDDNMGHDETFWRIELLPGTFATDENYARDVAFTYGSGFIPLKSGKEHFQRYAIACLFGTDQEDIFRNKRTMQKIYDLDYSFTKAPRKPVLTAMPGDKRVTLFWDKRAEKSRDPIYGRDFEAYKIYKSTEPYWNEIKTITDAWGNPLLLQPLAVFDLKDGLYGPHPVQFGVQGQGYGILQDMGTDSGLRHSYVDTVVDNGRTYYYAVVSMDKGYDLDFFSRGLSDKQNLSPIFPSECSAVIQTDALGRPTFIDRNCAVVTPVESSGGYDPPHLENNIQHINGTATGNMNVEILISSEIKTGHTYHLCFADNGSYESFNDDDAPEPVYTGMTAKASLVDVTAGDTLMNFGAPFQNSIISDQIIDGFHLFIYNQNRISLKSTGWTKGHSKLELAGYKDNDGWTGAPRDYEIRILEMGADTTYGFFSFQRKPTNFQIWDVTDADNPFKVAYEWIEGTKPDSLKGKFCSNERITLRVKKKTTASGSVSYQKKLWLFEFAAPSEISEDFDLIGIPQKGDVYRITTTKPFDRHDVFEFSMAGNIFNVQTAKRDLNDIYVVPDPYIAASTLEPRLIRQSGRGQRRIDFVNLPPKCTIRIFTMSGQMVQEIDHDSAMDNGREPWDMRTKDGLEVAFGIYIYHVDVQGIGEKIGRFSIIK